MGKTALTHNQKLKNREQFEELNYGKSRIVLRFNSIEKAQANLREDGFRFKESYSFKEDRALLYKHKRYNAWVKLYSTFDYLDDNTTDMGTVWLIEDVK